MRPKKTRWIKCQPGERCFRPQGVTLDKPQGIFLTLDEFEAMRLANFEGLKQEAAAQQMKISRPTFSRIISAAQTKVADAFVNNKVIKIEGGCCKFKRRK